MPSNKTMNLVVTRDLPALLNIEYSAHLFYDGDFGIMSVDEYVWNESEFVDCRNNGYALWGLYSSDSLLGFIAFRHDEEMGFIRIIKLEVLSDDRKQENLKYIVDWITKKALDRNILFMVAENDFNKIAVLRDGFTAELKKNAFRKNGLDGLMFSRKASVPCYT